MKFWKKLIAVSYTHLDVYKRQGLSVLAALFVIFIIPELWKNIENKSMEIEKSSLFDLRGVYAAKLIAFGLIDTGILTVFCRCV